MKTTSKVALVAPDIGIDRSADIITEAGHVVGSVLLSGDSAGTGAHGHTIAKTMDEATAGADAVVVARSVPDAAAHVLAAAKAGKDVFWVSPAGSPDDVRRCIDACAASGVRIGFGYALRDSGAHRQARDVVKGGSLGTPGVVRISRYERADRTARSDRDAVLSSLAEDLDWLLWTFGGIRSIHARISKDNGTCAIALVRFADGTIGHSMVSLGHARTRIGFEISGSTALVSFDSDKRAPLEVRPRNGTRFAAAGADAHADAVLAFAESRSLGAWLAGGETTVSGDDVLAALSVCEAAAGSARTNEPVILEAR